MFSSVLETFADPVKPTIASAVNATVNDCRMRRPHVEGKKSFLARTHAGESMGIVKFQNHLEPKSTVFQVD